MSEADNWPKPSEFNAGYSSSSSSEYAGFWLRFIAYICDAIMVSLVNLPVAILLASQDSINDTTLRMVELVVSTAALAYWIGNKGGSPLRVRLGVLVVDENDGSFIGSQRAVIRIAMSWVSGLVLLLGYISMLWNPRKQTWHDRVAHTVVVRA